MTPLKFILSEEGFRSKPYLDTEGVITFGHGLTYITEQESEYIVQQRVYHILSHLYSTYDWMIKLSENRKIAIISMVYQLGFTGFSKFKKMIKAIEEENWEKAKKEGLDSKWAKQTPERAKRQMEMLLRG